MANEPPQRMVVTSTKSVGIAILLTIPALSVFLVAFMLPSSPFAQTTPPWQVSAHSFGPVRIGMTLAQAEKASGKGLIGYGFSRAQLRTAGCAYVRFADDPNGVEFMTNRGVLVRIDVKSPPIATDRGARVGETEERVKSLYDNHLAIEDAKYDPNGHHLIYKPKETKNRIIFETDGKHVTYIRAGRLPEVEYVERCG